MLIQSGAQFRVRQITYPRAAHHYHIQSAQLGLAQPKSFAHQAFDAISAYCQPDALFGDHQTQARNITAIFSGAHRQAATR